MNKLTTRKTLISIIVGSLGLYSQYSFSAALEEIVVTAQKREQNVQDVPISITTISAEQIEARASVSLFELGSFAPNVQLDQGAFLVGSSQVLTGYIRGIGQSDVASSLDPGVGVYIDGVFLSRSIGANVELLDIDRIEILRGPQGTLFGRNTIGGAISLTTRRPGEELYGKVKATLGERNLIDLKGTFDIPVSDSLLSQFSFSRKQQDGYQDIIAFPGDPRTSDETALVNDQVSGTSISSSNTRGGLDNYTLRGKLLWMPSDVTDITLALDYSKADEESAAFSLVDTSQDTNPGSYAAAYNACVALDPVTLGAIGLGPICGTRTILNGTLPGLDIETPATRLLVADGLYDTGDIDKTYGNGGNSSDVETSGVTLTIDSELSELVNFKSITAYRKIESNIFNDLDGTPILLASTMFYLDHEQFSQEFQFNIDFLDDRLKTVSGLYYFSEESNNRESAIIGEGLGNFYGPYTTDNTSLAAYFNSSYQINEDFSLTFGARYTEDEKSFTVGQRGLNQSLIKLGIPAFLYPDQNDLSLIAAPGKTTNKYSDSSFRFGIEYFINDNMMTYASYSQGFKSGGISTRLSFPTPDNLPATFEPEYAETVEVGFKSQLLENSLQLNVAVFSSDYKDMQVTVTRGISPFFENAGEATIRGLEIESIASITDNFIISAGLGYIDAKYDKLDASVTSFTTSDMLVNTPKWSGNLSLDWDIFESFDGQFTFHTDFLYKDKMAKDAPNTPFIISDSYHLINTNLSWRSFNSGLLISLWGKNLTDERYISSASHVEAVGASTAIYNRPREVGLSLSYDF